MLRCLVNGVSMRATCRIVEVGINTVARLLREVGPIAAQYHDDYVRGVHAKRIQADELWAFISAKRKTAERLGRRDAGDLWTWTAFDPVSKLLVSYLYGPRTVVTAKLLMIDLRQRLVAVPEFTSDGLVSYAQAISAVWGKDAPYTRLVFNEKTAMAGAPDIEVAGTSFVERFNFTIRMENRRYTRLTNAHSKSVEQHRNMMALWALNYNWVRDHESLNTTPAVAAKIAPRPLSIDWIARLIEEGHPSARDIAARQAPNRRS